MEGRRRRYLSSYLTRVSLLQSSVPDRVKEVRHFLTAPSVVGAEAELLACSEAQMPNGVKKKEFWVRAAWRCPLSPDPQDLSLGLENGREQILSFENELEIDR
jgi:hypothetical protein